MPAKMKKGFRQLVDEANAEVETLTVEQAKKLQGDPNVLLVDIRDIRELEREGVVPGAFHAPRLVYGALTTLDTLPAREFRSGLAEVVKAGMVGDQRLIRLLEKELDRILKAVE